LHAAWKYLETKELISVLESVQYPGAASLLGGGTRTQRHDEHQGHGNGMYTPPPPTPKEPELPADPDSEGAAEEEEHGNRSKDSRHASQPIPRAS
jgi:hypothetical protein